MSNVKLTPSQTRALSYFLLSRLEQKRHKFPNATPVAKLVELGLISCLGEVAGVYEVTEAGRRYRA